MLAPPGGSSNISFGGYGTDEPKKTSQKPEAQRHEPVGQNQQDLYNPNPPQAIRPAGINHTSSGKSKNLGVQIALLKYILTCN